MNNLVREIYEANKSKGWWDSPRSPLEIHMLICTEIAEATEEVRKNSPDVYAIYNYSGDEDNIMEVCIGDKSVIVDKRDWELLSNYSWYISNDGNSDYLKANKDGTSVSFHNLVVNPPEGMLVDHINGDTLDNSRGNLRACSPSQNQANQRKQKRQTSSQYKGVTKKASGSFAAQIGFQGERLYLGTFNTEKEAALAYDHKSIELFGSFAKTNIIQTAIPEIIMFQGDTRWDSFHKAEGEAIELADAVIRIMDYFGHKGWDFEKIVRLKFEYNKTRSHRHGGKAY